MSNSGYGQAQPDDSVDEFTTAAFICRQLMAEMSTMKLVKVTAVTGGGEGQPAGTVDVQPLVSQIDGNGYGTSHGTVHSLPWSRMQGGKNAIICDPMVGDIGYVIASDRDISKVKNTKAAALPGTRRQFDIADGVYAGGCLNVAPNQYIIFTDKGVRLVDNFGNSITTTSAGINWTDANGNVLKSDSGGFEVTTVGFFKINGLDFVTHQHAVTTAPGITGPPEV